MEYYGWDALNDDYNDNNDDVPIVLYENDTNDEEKPVLNCDDKCIIDFIVYPDNINAIVNDNVNDNINAIVNDNVNDNVNAIVNDNVNEKPKRKFNKNINPACISSQETLKYKKLITYTRNINNKKDKYHNNLIDELIKNDVYADIYERFLSVDDNYDNLDDILNDEDLTILKMFNFIEPENLCDCYKMA